MWRGGSGVVLGSSLKPERDSGAVLAMPKTLTVWHPVRCFVSDYSVKHSLTQVLKQDKQERTYVPMLCSMYLCYSSRRCSMRNTWPRHKGTDVAPAVLLKGTMSSLGDSNERAPGRRILSMKKVTAERGLPMKVVAREAMICKDITAHCSHLIEAAQANLAS